MFLERAYKELQIVRLSGKLLHTCYELAADLPEEEKPVLARQIKSAALDTHLRISQGVASRSLKARLKYLTAARQSLVIADAAFEFALTRGYLPHDRVAELAEQLVGCYDLLEAMIDKLSVA